MCTELNSNLTCSFCVVVELLVTTEGGEKPFKLQAPVGRRGQFLDPVVQFLIGPVLCDVVQVAVKVHQQRVVAWLQHLGGDGPGLLPLPQHDPGQRRETQSSWTTGQRCLVSPHLLVLVFECPFGVLALVHDDGRNPIIWRHFTAVNLKDKMTQSIWVLPSKYLDKTGPTINKTALSNCSEILSAILKAHGVGLWRPK